MNSFWIRLRSSIILMAVVIPCLYFGGVALAAMTAFVSFVGLFEFYKACGLNHTKLFIAGMTGCALYLAAAFSGRHELLLFALFLGMAAILGVYVLTFPEYEISRTAEAVFGLLYVPVMLSFIWMIRQMEGGRLLVWLVFAASWGSDVCAYCSGMLFGKHKLTPVLSPKKSVEGAAGAVIGTALLGLVYALLFRKKLGYGTEALWVLPLLCAFGSVLSQIGDLAASAVKRNKNIKDYGTLIPGHGGILDRFDSVIITAPVVYYLILLFL